MSDSPSSAPLGRQAALPVAVMLTVLILTALIALKLGTPALSWKRLFEALATDEGERLARVIVREIRLPRFLLGMMVGALLAVAGALMQGAMNNRLAGPDLLGVSAGASLAAAAITVLHLPIPYGLHPLLALAGGLAGGTVVMLAARGSTGAVGLLLIGMSVSAILSGLLIVLIAMGTSNDVNLLYAYLLGSLANRGWDHLERLLPWFVVLLPVSMPFARALNLLQLGDESASGLGLKVDRMRMLMLVVCAALVAATVAQCGPIGFVSLLAPHLTRAVLRSADARIVLPVCAVCGAALLAVADQIARLLLAPLEIPVGVWTTLVGGSVFLLFVLRRGRREFF